MTSEFRLGIWQMPTWRVLGRQVFMAALTLIFVLGIASLFSRGEDGGAMEASVLLAAELAFCYSIYRTFVVSLERRGDVLEWRGILGNNGSVRFEDIVGVTGGFYPSWTLIRRKQGAPLRVSGASREEIRRLVKWTEDPPL